MLKNNFEKWEEKTLGEIASIKGGKRLPKGEKLSTEKTNHPYIRVTDFNDRGTVDIDNVQFITDGIYEQIKNYTISSSDLYISIAGTIGKSGIIPKELDGANLTENACKLVYKTKNISNRYVYYYTQTNLFKEQIFDKTKMAAMPKLALTRLATVKLLVPSLLEQERIVAKLDKSFEAIDKVKANAEQNLTNAKELFESALNKVFTENTEGWEEKTLGEVTQIISGTTPDTTNVKFWGNENYWITPAEINENCLYVRDTARKITNYAIESCSLRPMPRGTVIFSSRAPIGKLAISDVDVLYCNQGFKNFICSKCLNSKFLYYFLLKNKQYLISLGKGTTFKEVSKSIVSSVEIKYPPLSEQQKIVEKLDKLQEQTKQLEAIYTQKIKDLDELKQSILQKAFRGEL